MRRILAIAALGLSALLAGLPVAAASSDSEAFATYYSEFHESERAINKLFVQFQLAPSASEKSTLGHEVRSALLVTIETFDEAEVRECYAGFALLVTEFFEALALYFEDVDRSPSLASARLASASSLFGSIQAEVGPSVIACAEVE